MPATEPKLREYQEPRAGHAWDRVSEGFGRFLREMEKAFPYARRRAFEQSMQDPRNVAEYEAGYSEGRAAGVAAAFGDFRKRIAYTLDLLYSLMDPEVMPFLIAGSIATYLQPDGTPIPPALRREMEAALWFQHLKTFVPLLEAADKGKLLELIELTMNEIVNAMVEAGPEWVNGFFALTGRPREQGRYAGRLIGRACGEIFVAVIEEVAEVPILAPPPVTHGVGEVAQ